MCMAMLQEHLDATNASIKLREPIIQIVENVVEDNGFLYARFFNDELFTPGHEKSIGGRLMKFWKVRKKKNDPSWARTHNGLILRVNQELKAKKLGRYRAINHAILDITCEVVIHSIIIVDKQATVKSC